MEELSEKTSVCLFVQIDIENRAFVGTLELDINIKI
jgi:hypothetical protein